MTKQAELRFVCNRCHTEATIALQNVSAPLQFPGEWGVFKVGMAEVEMHLCPGCTAAFDRFMANKE